MGDGFQAGFNELPFNEIMRYLGVIRAYLYIEPSSVEKQLWGINLYRVLRFTAGRFKWMCILILRISVKGVTKEVDNLYA